MTYRKTQLSSNRAREIVDAAKPALKIPPIDCTNHCGDGPCDCSGEWRIRAWSLDMAELREALGLDPKPETARYGD